MHVPTETRQSPFGSPIFCRAGRIGKFGCTLAPAPLVRAGCRKPPPLSRAVLDRRRTVADATVQTVRQACIDTLAEPLPDRLALLMRQLEVPH
jgi:hypothetical protein